MIGVFSNFELVRTLCVMCDVCVCVRVCVMCVVCDVCGV